MIVNLEKSFSMKNCSMVKKILKILYTCLKIKVYYVFLFLKVNQCKLKQKETILKLGNPLKSKSKFTNSKIGLDASTSTPYQGFTLNLTGVLPTLGRIFSPSIILRSPPIKICSENTAYIFQAKYARNKKINENKLVGGTTIWGPVYKHLWDNLVEIMLPKNFLSVSLI